MSRFWPQLFWRSAPYVREKEILPMAITATMTYEPTSVPETSPQPVVWYVGMRDPAGNAVGAEQTSPTPEVQMEFTGLAPGTYEAWGGQRDAAGLAVGNIVKSAPFTVVAEIVIQLMGTIAVSQTGTLTVSTT